MTTYVFAVLTIVVTGLGGLTDLRSGKVQNRLLLAASLIGLAFACADASIHHAWSMVNFWHFLNVLLTLGIALIFYLTDIWAPGDCKLMIFVSLFFPMEWYTVRERNLFPTLDIVVYAFALGYLGLLLSLPFHKKNERASKKADFNKPMFEASVICSFAANVGILSAATAALDLFAGDFYYANSILCLLALIGLISVLQRRAFYVKNVLGAVGLLTFAIQTVAFGTWLSALLGLLQSIAIAAVLEVLNDKVRKNTYREITGEEVRPGMILSYASVWSMQNCIDPDIPRTTIENRRSRMTDAQARAVKTWCANAHRNVVIVEMIPFAPFIALAVIVQIIRYWTLV